MWAGKPLEAMGGLCKLCDGTVQHISTTTLADCPCLQPESKRRVAPAHAHALALQLPVPDCRQLCCGTRGCIEMQFDVFLVLTPVRITLSATLHFVHSHAKPPHKTVTAAAGGGVWHKASVSDCLPLAAPIGLSPLLILTLCGPERVLVVSTEPLDEQEGGGGGQTRKSAKQHLQHLTAHCAGIYHYTT